MSDLIDAVQSEIEAITNRSLATAAEYTEYHTALTSPLGYGYILVNVPPIAAGTTPTVVDDRRWAARTIASTNIVLDTDDNGDNYAAGMIQLWNNEGYFAAGSRNVTVTYTGGWTTSTFPARLKEAWIKLVQLLFENPDRIGVIRSSDGGGSVEWDKEEIPTAIRQTIEGYTVSRPGAVF